MSLFGKLPTSLPVPQLPVAGPLAGALLGNSSNKAGAASTPPATNAANATQPFQIPFANPLTGAVQFIQGTAAEGLKNLDDGAKAVLANAAEIPIVHSDGSVTVVPGGAAGLQALHDNAAQVLSTAPAATKLDPTADVTSNINGLAGETAASSGTSPSAPGKAAPLNPFQLLPNPITGAASLVQGTFDAGVKGLNTLSEQTIGNAPQLPIVLPSGQLSIVKGGVDGLNALKDNAHSVLENAPKLPGVLDIASGATGALTNGLAGGIGAVGGGLGALGGGPGGGLVGGLVGGVLDAVTGGQSAALLKSVQQSKGLIQTILALPGQAQAVLQKVTANAKALSNFATDEKVGPAEIDNFLAHHANTVAKLTVAVFMAVSGVFGVGGAIVLVGLLLMIACLPALGVLLGLMAFEVLIWRHWKNVRAKDAAANGTAKGNGVAITGAR